MVAVRECRASCSSMGETSCFGGQGQARPRPMHGPAHSTGRAHAPESCRFRCIHQWQGPNLAPGRNLIGTPVPSPAVRHPPGAHCGYVQACERRCIYPPRTRRVPNNNSELQGLACGPGERHPISDVKSEWRVHWEASCPGPGMKHRCGRQHRPVGTLGTPRRTRATPPPLVRNPTLAIPLHCPWCLPSMYLPRTRCVPMPGNQWRLRPMASGHCFPSGDGGRVSGPADGLERTRLETSGPAAIHAGRPLQVPLCSPHGHLLVHVNSP